MRLLPHTPEDGIEELWKWNTDIIVSDDGTEQRISVLQIPKRSMSIKLQYVDEAELRRDLRAVMAGYAEPMEVPLFQYQTRLKAAAANAATALVFDAAKTELRDGCRAIIIDHNGYQLLNIDEVSEDGATLNNALTRAFSRKSIICPVSEMIGTGNASFNRKNVNAVATANFNFIELGFIDTFLNVFNEAELFELDGTIVFTPIAKGTEFIEDYDTGNEITDYGAIVEVRSPWSHAQINLQRSFKVNRYFDSAEYAYMFAFADAVKGSQHAFYLPTYREDFETVIQAAPGGNTIRFAGDAYRADYFPFAPFKQIAIYSAAGVHYARVTLCTLTGGNNALTFDPPLPNDAAWGVDQKAGLLLKVRIADDRITLTHSAMSTTFGLSLRTADA